MSNAKSWFCKSCGEAHDNLPLSYAVEAPDYVYGIPEIEWEYRVEMNEDICAIDDKYFFIKGCIEIPVLGSRDPLIWESWVSLSEENFEQSLEHWELEGRETLLKPMFGWLSTSLPGYPDTLNLRTMVHTRTIGERPFIELEPTDHPLAVEQHEGIPATRIREIAEEICALFSD